MSIRNPMEWLKNQQPGVNYDKITLRVKDGLNGRKAYPIYTYGKGSLHAYDAIVDWLERSPVYVWPYAEAFAEGSVREITLTLKIDAAVNTAASSVDGNAIHYSLAESVSRVLAALSSHVDNETRGTIFINVPK